MGRRDCSALGWSAGNARVGVVRAGAGLICSMWIGDGMLVILNLPLIGIDQAADGSVPPALPAILHFCCTGACSVYSNVWDVMMTIPRAILGYAFKKLD